MKARVPQAALAASILLLMIYPIKGKDEQERKLLNTFEVAKKDESTTTTTTLYIETEVDESCRICPIGQQVTRPFFVVELAGGYLTEQETFMTCSYLQQQMNKMPERFTSCEPSFESLYAEDCKCEPPASSPAPTLAPPPTVPPSATTIPTGSPVAEIEEEMETMIHGTCHICPAGQNVTLPMTLIELPAKYYSLTPGSSNNNNGNTIVTCSLLANSLESHPDLFVTPCEPSFVELFAVACGCATVESLPPTNSPVVESVAEDNVPTSSPVVAMEVEDEDETTPTATPPPLVGWCSLCPFGEEITLPNAIVPVPDDDLISPDISYTTCALLQLAAKNLESLQDKCLELPSMYAESCGCAPAIAPTAAPVAEIVAEEDDTGPPTVNTEEATIACAICELGQVITKPDVVIVLAKGTVVAGSEVYVTCELLDLAAKEKHISIIDLCPDLNAIYGEACGCSVSEANLLLMKTVTAVLMVIVCLMPF